MIAEARGIASIPDDSVRRTAPLLSLHHDVQPLRNADLLGGDLVRVQGLGWLGQLAFICATHGFVRSPWADVRGKLARDLGAHGLHRFCRRRCRIGTQSVWA